MKKIERQRASIEGLAVAKSLIDLETHIEDTFTLLGYKLSHLFDNIILAQYVDTEDNEVVSRNGIVIPLNAQTKAWRLGRVVLAGPNCKMTKVDDIVCFPNDKGIPVNNIQVENVGIVKHGMFLDESRLFGICKPTDDE
jgi:co-chaperonin GroES (HSP10)